MARGYAYPADLARYVEAHWPSGLAALTLSPKLLEKAPNPKWPCALGQVGGANAGMNERNAELLRATLCQSGR